MRQHLFAVQTLAITSLNSSLGLIYASANFSVCFLSQSALPIHLPCNLLILKKLFALDMMMLSTHPWRYHKQKIETTLNRTKCFDQRMSTWVRIMYHAE